jgi:hypothetical protein
LSIFSTWSNVCSSNDFRFVEEELELELEEMEAEEEEEETDLVELLLLMVVVIEVEDVKEEVGEETTADLFVLIMIRL